MPLGEVLNAIWAAVRYFLEFATDEIDDPSNENITRAGAAAVEHVRGLPFSAYYSTSLWWLSFIARMVDMTASCFSLSISALRHLLSTTMGPWIAEVAVLTIYLYIATIIVWLIKAGLAPPPPPPPPPPQARVADQGELPPIDPELLPES